MIAVGNRIVNRETEYSCEFAISPSEEGIADGFRMGSEIDPISEDLLAQIERHSSYLSLYSNRYGASDALAISEIALAALDIGGLAVRVEGSKRASDAEQWRKGVQKAKESFPELVKHLFVWAFVTDGKTFETIGMPFLGHPDISVETPDFETAKIIYDELSGYLLHCKPDIFDGETIGFENADGVWRMSKVSHIYSDDPDIDFSLGMWRLRRITE